MTEQEQHYPFPRKILRETAFPWYVNLWVRVFGKRYHSVSLPWELIAYHYKGRLYITKYGRVYD